MPPLIKIEVDGELWDWDEDNKRYWCEGDVGPGYMEWVWHIKEPKDWQEGG
jgi:hypothetical protein